MAVPVELAWKFSPVGLLQGITPEHLEFETGSWFQGQFSYAFDYLAVFLATCLLELPFCWLAFRNLSPARIFLVLLFLNLATHPIVFFVIPLFFEKYLHAALVAEAFAAGAEMFLAVSLVSTFRNRISRYEGLAAAALVLLANLFSWELGIFL